MGDISWLFKCTSQLSGESQSANMSRVNFYHEAIGNEAGDRTRIRGSRGTRAFKKKSTSDIIKAHIDSSKVKVNRDEHSKVSLRLAVNEADSITIPDVKSSEKTEHYNFAPISVNDATVNDTKITVNTEDEEVMHEEITRDLESIVCEDPQLKDDDALPKIKSVQVIDVKNNQDVSDTSNDEDIQNKVDDAMQEIRPEMDIGEKENQNETEAETETEITKDEEPQYDDDSLPAIHPELAIDEKDNHNESENAKDEDPQHEDENTLPEFHPESAKVMKENQDVPKNTKNEDSNREDTLQEINFEQGKDRARKIIPDEIEKNEDPQKKDENSIHENIVETADEVLNQADSSGTIDDTENGESILNKKINSTITGGADLLEGRVIDIEPAQEEASTEAAFYVPIKNVTEISESLNKKTTDDAIAITMLPETTEQFKEPTQDKDIVDETKDEIILAKPGPIAKKEDIVLNIENEEESKGEKEEKLLILIIKSMIEFLNSKNFLGFLLFMAALATVAYFAHKNQPTPIVFDKELFAQLNHTISNADV